MMNIFNSTLVLFFMMMGSLKSINEFEVKKIGGFIGSVFMGVLLFQLFFSLEKDVNTEFFDEMEKRVES